MTDETEQFETLLDRFDHATFALGTWDPKPVDAPETVQQDYRDTRRALVAFVRERLPVRVTEAQLRQFHPHAAGDCVSPASTAEPSRTEDAP